MDFLELAKKRYNCRNYLAKDVEESKLEDIFKACQLTPTACNKFPIRLIVLKTEESRKKLVECTKFPFNAPITIICCYNQNESWLRKSDGINYGGVDTSLAMMNMMLEATNLGLATCFIGVFNEQKVKENYNLPNEYSVVGLLMLGYPNDIPADMHNIRPKLNSFIKIE